MSTESGDDVRARVRAILINDWDPSNVARSEYARAEYDGYISPLLDLIRSGASEDDIVAWLHEREQETMCFPSLGTQRLRRVAQKLLRLKGA